MQLCRNARRQRCHAPALWHSCGRAAPSRAKEESGSRNRRRSGFRCVCFGSLGWSLVGDALAGCPCTQRQGLQFAYQFSTFSLTTQHEEYMHSGNTTATGGGSARPAFIFQPLHGKDLLLICVHIFGILFSLLVIITSEQEKNYHSITSNASTKLPISKNFFQFAPFSASRWENSATNS